jgi:hypothetical protein
METEEKRRREKDHGEEKSKESFHQNLPLLFLTKTEQKSTPKTPPKPSVVSSSVPRLPRPEERGEMHASGKILSQNFFEPEGMVMQD